MHIYIERHENQIAYWIHAANAPTVGRTRKARRINIGIAKWPQ